VKIYKAIISKSESAQRGPSHHAPPTYATAPLVREDGFL